MLTSLLRRWRSGSNHTHRRPLPRLGAAKTRLRLEPLEDRTLPSIDVLTSYAGLDYRDGGHFRPPDTIAAVGPNHVVEMINSQIAFLDKTTGARLFQQTLNDFFAPVLAADPYAGDPVVAYDEQAHRFFVGALDFGHDTFRTGREESFFYFAVSNTANPLDGFSEMHRIDTKRIFGGAPRVADFPRIGWNADAYVFTFRMFSFPFSTQVFSHMQILSIDKSTVLDADPATLTKYHHDRPAGTGLNLAPATMHGSAPGGSMWLVGTSAVAAGSLNVLRMDNVLSATPTFTNTAVPVPFFSTPPFATQPDGGAMTVNSTRILNAAWRDDRLVASMRGAESGGVSRARWYEFSTAGASPTLAQSGEINQGPGVHTYYPAIEIAANGDLGLTFMQSSPTEYVSMYVTGRKPTDPPGVMRPPVLVKAGEAPSTPSIPRPMI